MCVRVCPSFSFLRITRHVRLAPRLEDSRLRVSCGSTPTTTARLLQPKPQSTPYPWYPRPYHWLIQTLVSLLWAASTSATIQTPPIIGVIGWDYPFTLTSGFEQTLLACRWNRRGFKPNVALPTLVSSSRRRALLTEAVLWCFTSSNASRRLSQPSTAPPRKRFRMWPLASPSPKNNRNRSLKLLKPVLLEGS